MDQFDVWRNANLSDLFFCFIQLFRSIVKLFFPDLKIETEDRDVILQLIVKTQETTRILISNTSDIMKLVGQKIKELEEYEENNFPCRKEQFQTSNREV